MITRWNRDSVQPAPGSDTKVSRPHLLAYDGGPKGARNLTPLINRNAAFHRSLSVYETVQVWTPAIFAGTLFYEAHKAILDARRLAGWCLWKPYIILRRLEQLPDGDVLLYLDGDSRMSEVPRGWLAHAESNKGIAALACHSRWSNQAMTKRDALILLAVDSEPFLSAPQIVGGLLLVINSAQARALVLDWLLASCNPDILTDSPSRLAAEHPKFQAHRTQSVLSAVLYKHGIAAMPNSENRHFQHNDRWNTTNP